MALPEPGSPQQESKPYGNRAQPLLSGVDSAYGTYWGTLAELEWWSEWLYLTDDQIIALHDWEEERSAREDAETKAYSDFLIAERRRALYRANLETFGRPSLPSVSGQEQSLTSGTGGAGSPVGIAGASDTAATPDKVWELEFEMIASGKTDVTKRQNADGTWTISWKEENGEYGGVTVSADGSVWEFLTPGTVDPIGTDKILGPTSSAPTPGSEAPTGEVTPSASASSSVVASTEPTGPGIAAAAWAGASAGITLSNPMRLSEFLGVDELVREGLIRPAIAINQRLSPMNNVRRAIDRATGTSPPFDRDAFQSGLIVAALGAFGANPKETLEERAVREGLASRFEPYVGKLAGQIIAALPYIGAEVGAGLIPVGPNFRGETEFPHGTLGAARNKVPTPRENPWGFESNDPAIAQEFVDEFLVKTREINPLKAETAQNLAKSTGLPAEGFSKVSSTTYYDDMNNPFEYHWHEHALRPGERIDPKIKYLDEE